jgi:hypothetical protein
MELRPGTQAGNSGRELRPGTQAGNSGKESPREMHVAVGPNLTETLRRIATLPAYLLVPRP